MVSSFNNNYLLMCKITPPFTRTCKESESNVLPLIISSITQTLTQNVFVPEQDYRGTFFLFIWVLSTLLELAEWVGWSANGTLKLCQTGGDAHD